MLRDRERDGASEGDGAGRHGGLAGRQEEVKADVETGKQRRPLTDEAQTLRTNCL